MKKKIFHKPRTIYIFEFPDKSAYIGLTWRKVSTRLSGHKSAPNKFMKENFSIFGDNFKIKNNGIYYPEDMAQQLEGLWRIKYEEEGWKILNMAKTGGLGGNKIWRTKKNCAAEAKKYDNLEDFRANSGAYSVARKKGWIDDICRHMTPGKLPNGHWKNKENGRKLALQFKDHEEFREKAPGAYAQIWFHGYLKEVTRHMILKRKPNGYWTKERCRKEARKYETRGLFKLGNIGAFTSAEKNSWLDEICKQMPPKRKPIGFWNIKENSLEESKKYEKPSLFKKFSSMAYKASGQNGWLKEFYPSK